MFEKIKEKIRQQQEAEEQKRKEEIEELLALSEKELLVELIFELRNLGEKLDDIESTVSYISINN